MRVVAGMLGGRALRAPRGSGTRPTSDRVREAVFSMLGESVGGAAVLDLFAGSGALGIEALSRGAATVTFVERDRAAVAVVRANLAAVGIGGEASAVDALGTVAEVTAGEALGWLGAAARAARQYDLVFLDPPYGLAGELGPALSSALPPVLAPDARVVAESDRRLPLDLALPLARERRYGDTLIRIHEHHNEH